VSFSRNDVESAIDESLIVDLAKRVIETPSPTGEEGGFARLLVSEMTELGLRAELQPLYEDRENAVGVLRGSSGDAPRVLWSGHMDTSVRGDEDWLVGPGWKNTAVVQDGVVYGNGIFNMKSAFVAYLAAIDALRRLGAELPGDLVVAGTVGEIELAPVEEFTGRRFDSQGVGLRHLLTHGVTADYHILGEPTGLVPYLGNPGTAWARIKVAGAYSHTAFSDRGTHAIEQMWRLWRGLDEWIERFQRDNVYHGITPQVNRAAIRGGAPWRAARTPASCSMYVDIRFPPHRFPIDVQREFEAAVRHVADREGIADVDVYWYVARPGTLLDEGHPLVQTVADTHRQVLTDGGDPEPFICVCSDAIDANRLGVPTLQYGVGRAPESATTGYSADPRVRLGEYARIDDMVAVTQVFLLSTQSLMSGGLDAVRASRPVMPATTPCRSE